MLTRQPPRDPHTGLEKEVGFTIAIKTMKSGTQRLPVSGFIEALARMVSAGDQPIDADHIAAGEYRHHDGKRHRRHHRSL